MNENVGLPPNADEVLPIFAEYARLKRAAELGATFDLNSFDQYVLNLFEEVGAALKKHEQARLAKRSKK